jgi:hypothetical protein
VPLIAIYFDGNGSKPTVSAWLRHLIYRELLPLQTSGIFTIFSTYVIFSVFTCGRFIAAGVLTSSPCAGVWVFHPQLGHHAVKAFALVDNGLGDIPAIRSAMCLKFSGYQSCNQCESMPPVFIERINY